MLRHYDLIGLLVPDRVHAGSGYRSYAPDQLHLLNRIVALKDLGFTLERVRRLLDDDLDPAELRGMLRLRRAQLEDEARTVDTRLNAVETRLQMIEKENTMTADYVVKTIPAVRLVASRATLEPDRLGEHIGPMFDEVATALRHARGALDTPIATYAETETGMDVVVGYENPGPPPDGTEMLDLPEVRAVCGVHLGAMTGIHPSWQDLHRWFIENGYTFSGPRRELYVRAESDDQTDWVTELQQPVTKA
ncbi:GyrI-like domain-containing protein [Nakamurella sp. PAMC28650]|nr:GyrI-like domain-containing protein [Nakamurella sp. PAMC28650]